MIFQSSSSAFLVHETSLNDLTTTNTSIYSPIIVTSTAQTDRVKKNVWNDKKKIIQVIHDFGIKSL